MTESQTLCRLRLRPGGSWLEDHSIKLNSVDYESVTVVRRPGRPAARPPGQGRAGTVLGPRDPCTKQYNDLDVICILPPRGGSVDAAFPSLFVMVAKVGSIVKVLSRSGPHRPARRPMTIVPLKRRRASVPRRAEAGREEQRRRTSEVLEDIDHHDLIGPRVSDAGRPQSARAASTTSLHRRQPRLRPRPGLRRAGIVTVISS